MASSPQLRPLGEALGTEVLGIDLSRPVDDVTFAWIAKAFGEHPVLVFRDQNSVSPAVAGRAWKQISRPIFSACCSRSPALMKRELVLMPHDNHSEETVSLTVESDCGINLGCGPTALDRVRKTLSESTSGMLPTKCTIGCRL